MSTRPVIRFPGTDSLPDPRSRQLKLMWRLRPQPLLPCPRLSCRERLSTRALASRRLHADVSACKSSHATPRTQLFNNKYNRAYTTKWIGPRRLVLGLLFVPLHSFTLSLIIIFLLFFFLRFFVLSVFSFASEDGRVEAGRGVWGQRQAPASKRMCTLVGLEVSPSPRCQDCQPRS